MAIITILQHVYAKFAPQLAHLARLKVQRPALAAVQIH